MPLFVWNKSNNCKEGTRKKIGRSRGIKMHKERGREGEKLFQAWGGEKNIFSSPMEIFIWHSCCPLTLFSETSNAVGVQNGWISMESFTQEWWKLSFISLLGNLQQRELEMGKGPADKPCGPEMELYFWTEKSPSEKIALQLVGTVCIILYKRKKGKEKKKRKEGNRRVWSMSICFWILNWG